MKKQIYVRPVITFVGLDNDVVKICTSPPTEYEGGNPRNNINSVCLEQDDTPSGTIFNTDAFVQDHISW